MKTIREGGESEPDSGPRNPQKRQPEEKCNRRAEREENKFRNSERVNGPGQEHLPMRVASTNELVKRKEKSRVKDIKKDPT